VKRLILLLAAFAFVVRADDLTPVPAAAPADSTATAASGEDASAEHNGFPSTRYEQLWSKSPFSVETPDAVTTDSADYALVGVAQLGDVTYASLVDKHTNSHILVSSDKPLGNLSVTSVTKRSDGIYVSLTQSGSPLTLKLESAPATGAPPMPGAAPFGGPNQGAMPNIPMPGAQGQQYLPPRVRIHRPLIHLPPRYPNQSVPGATGQPSPP
jgi:hypothetical protein